MRPKVKQLGILPDLDSQDPADYSDTVMNPLSRQTWLAIKDKGLAGATSKEIAQQLNKTHKSIAGRFAELLNVRLLRHTEAYRNDCVVCVTVGDALSW